MPATIKQVALLLALCGLAGCADTRDWLERTDSYLSEKITTYDEAFHSQMAANVGGGANVRTTAPADAATVQSMERELLTAAKAGDARAQYLIGAVQLATADSNAGRQEAVSWLRRSAAQGHADAQFALGEAYLNGQGAPAEPGTAATWFAKAAKGGQPQAQFMLANLYMTGRGVPTNRSTALEWYGRAAANGHPEAARYRDALKASAIRQTAKRP